MIGQVNTVDGNKTVLPLAGSIPVGNPVGSFLYTYKKLQPRNYLYCDGSTFDQNQYPALFMYLNSNVLPDYRECAMVGAEQNTTDTIAEHDIFTQGEFKDDQLQDHSHKVKRTGLAGGSAMEGVVNWTSGGNQVNTSKASIAQDARTGATTRGKRKAVYVYIKAVDGVDISDEDTFLDTVKNYIGDTQSYSTEETLTGGKWIDGKPIYRRVFKTTSNLSNSTWGWGGLSSNIFADVDTLIDCIGSIVENGTNSYSICCYAKKAAGFYLQNTSAPANSYFIVKYTKTTD